MKLGSLARYALIALGLVGTLAGAKLSILHLETGETCPIIGPLPACYIVALGYFMVAVSAIFASAKWSKLVFIFGWAPIAALAFFGVMLEVIGQDVCPPGTFGLPQCFYSFGMAILCLSLFWFSRARTKSTNIGEN